jgi:hypothetical protein
MRSNYLSVCFFPQVIENIPLASPARFLKVGENRPLPEKFMRSLPKSVPKSRPATRSSRQGYPSLGDAPAMVVI